MLLTLEVISANGGALGANRRKTVGPEGASIGRSRECDWVINDQYISRTHAQIRCVGGAFYIEGVGRNPLAMNDPNQLVPNNEPQLLRNGDRVFLDEYEIRVTTSTDRTLPNEPAGYPEDPFAEPADGTVRMPGSSGPLMSTRAADDRDGLDEWAHGIVDGTSDDGGSLDPLAALGGSSDAGQPPPLPPVNIHQGSVLDNNVRLPKPSSLPTQPESIGGSSSTMGKIPDTWDRSGFTQMGQQNAPPPKKPPASVTRQGIAARANPPPSDSSIPDTWDKSRLTQMDMPPVAAKPPSNPSRLGSSTRFFQAPDANPRAAQPPPTVRRPPDSFQAFDQQPPPPAEKPYSQPTEHRKPAAPPSGAAAASGGSSLDLEELLQAAGLNSVQMSPELARELGQVLRIVVQGLMEVLQSRAEIKSQLRMSMTRMQATENNPLKFSPNVEAALHTLLVERNRGYLPTTRAFQEALVDIRNHQIAVLQGIRRAFDTMLEHFDPQRLTEEFDRQSKRGGILSMGAKLRFREYYTEHYASLTRDADSSFRQLFGEYFAQAYEDQMDRLKSAGRQQGR